MELYSEVKKERRIVSVQAPRYDGGNSPKLLARDLTTDTNHENHVTVKMNSNGNWAIAHGPSIVTQKCITLCL
jgi:hypothetical protein